MESEPASNAPARSFAVDRTRRAVEPMLRNVFFAAPADDPRARRPVDAALLAIACVTAGAMGWLHHSRVELDARVLAFVGDGVPSWIRGVASMSFALGGLYGLGLVVGIGIFGRGRLKIVRDLSVAIAIAAGIVLAAAYLAGPEFPDVFPEWGYDGYPSYPVARLSIAVAAILVARPFLSLPVRRIGSRLVMAMAFSAVILTFGTVTAVIGGLAIGAVAASTVHLVFGSGRGIPSRARVLDALERAGLDVSSLDYLAEQPIGATLMRAELVGGDSILVKVYGRDAADAELASKLWRAMWYRDSDWALLETTTQLAEHESLILLACERAGVPAPRLVAWTKARTDDAIVITEWPEGTPLALLDDAAVDDSVLDRAWQALGAFHAGGIVHRALDRTRILVTADGVAFREFEAARVVGDDDDARADAAQLLVATAISTGVHTAVAAARRNLGDDALLRTLPLLQGPALPRGLQRQVRASDLKVADLRDEITASLGGAPSELAQLRRVSWGNVAMVALTLFAASSLVSSLAGIGFDTIGRQLADANWGWVLAALVAAQLTNVGEYVTLVGVTGAPVPFGPTIMFRYALSFVSLAVPSDAGAIAMNVRYQQKLGVPPVAAVAQGPLITIVSKGFDVGLMLLTATAVGRTIDTDVIDLGPVVRLIAVVVIVAVLALAAVFFTPKLRAWMLPRLREGVSAIAGAVTDPQRLFRIVSGTLMQKVLFALTLSASVAAYTSAISFSEALFVNCAVSLFVGFVPVPGGIGVGETALTAGLIAVGVPEAPAFAAAITHRMVTAYLPPTFGWWASRWLTRRDYL